MDQQIIQQQAQLIEQLLQQNQQQQQQIMQYQKQVQQLQHGDVPLAEVQQVEEQVEPPAPPPQLPVTSSEMFNACEDGDTGKIMSLIEAGENPNSVNDDGNTPVMTAIGWGHLSTAKLLFGFGADLSTVDEVGRHALHSAMESGDIPNLQMQSS
jgi:ankyrin repeat protein